MAIESEKMVALQPKKICVTDDHPSAHASLESKHRPYISCELGKTSAVSRIFFGVCDRSDFEAIVATKHSLYYS